jgi:hypothetical protein
MTSTLDGALDSEFAEHPRSTAATASASHTDSDTGSQTGTETTPVSHRAPDVASPRRPWASALALYGTLKLLGFTVFLVLVNSTADIKGKKTQAGADAHIWDVLTSWDGWWYRKIAENGYDPKLVPIPGNNGHWSVEQNSAAFFPLYPGLIRLVSAVTGLGSFGAGLTVSIVASFVAAAGIYAVVVLLAGHRAAVCAAGLWAVWPGSGVEWTVYSESVYVALAAWTCHAVMTRRWLPAGFLSLTAGLSRPSALPLIAAVVVPALLAAWRREDGIKRPLVAASLAPLGFLGYVTWLGVKAGNLRAFLILESDGWDHYIDYGSQTLHIMGSVLVGRTDYDFASSSTDLIGVGVVLLSVILLAVLIGQRPPAVLLIFTVLTMALTLSSHQFFSSVSRYMLPVFPLLIPCAVAVSRLKAPVRATALTVTALASGSYAGYMIFVLAIP